MAAVDVNDPCALLTAMREVYYAVAAGGQVTSIQFADRKVTYSGADLVFLRSEIARLQIECAQKQGKTSPRFAISAGGGRRIGGW